MHPFSKYLVFCLSKKKTLSTVLNYIIVNNDRFFVYTIPLTRPASLLQLYADYVMFAKKVASYPKDSTSISVYPTFHLEILSVTSPPCSVNVNSMGKNKMDMAKQRL